MTTREENLKKINAELEQLSDEELEKVAGGTVGELEDLTKAIVSNPTLQFLGKANSHIPGANRLVADAVEGILKDHLNIDADISLGAFGTGAGSAKNTYRDMETGKYMTHAEVLDRIKQFS